MVLLIGMSSYFLTTVVVAAIGSQVVVAAIGSQVVSRIMA